MEEKMWIKQAEADLKTANNSLLSKDYYASIFWSQQAVEKSLKAVIIKTKRKLVKIHDLVILGRLADLPKFFLEKCEMLSKVYVETRYGFLDNEIPAKKFKESDAFKFINIAKEVLEWARKI